MTEALMAEQMQSSTVPAWQQAADSKLVRWLWRQLERPGLLYQQQAPQLLARYQGMVNGLPLATALHRRASIGADAQGAQGPIVYVTPPPWSLPVSLTPTSTPALSQSSTQSLPVVTQVRPVTGSTPAVVADPAPPQIAVPAQSSPPLVIQRQAMPGATPAPSTTTSSGALPPVANLSPTMEAKPGAGRAGIYTGGLPLPPRRTSAGVGTIALTPRSGQTELNLAQPTPVAPIPAPLLHPVVSARFIREDLSAPMRGIPLVSAALPAPPSLAGAPLATASPALYPVVRVEPPGRHLQTSTPSNPTVSPDVAPTVSAIPGRNAVALVVREQVLPTQPITPALPVARPTEPLPLVTVAIPTPQRALDHARNLVSTTTIRMAGHERQPQAPLATRSVGQNPTSGAANPRQPAAEVQPAPPVDIDGLVDRVHRRFLQTLALEGERRGRR